MYLFVNGVNESHVREILSVLRRGLTAFRCSQRPSTDFTLHIPATQVGPGQYPLAAVPNKKESESPKVLHDQSPRTICCLEPSC